MTNESNHGDCTNRMLLGVDLKKNQITGGAIIELSNLIHRLDKEYKETYMEFSNNIDKFANTRRWTFGAIECYKRGCNCSGCFYKEFFKGTTQKCRMRSSVIYLVRKFGKPEGVETKGIID